MKTISAQLSATNDVLTHMGSDDQDRPMRQDDRRITQVVAPPQPHEGVREALSGSFGSIPATPTEFATLLNRLH